MNVLNKALSSPDNNIVSYTASKAIPVLSQAYIMYSLLKELQGQFDNKDNTYNQQISDILRYIEEDKEKMETKDE